MTAYKHIFTPIRIGKLTVKNRIEVAPMMPMIAAADCGVGQEMMEWTRTLARGGAGLVTLGDTNIAGEMSLAVGHVLTLGFDRSINDIDRLVEIIKRYGAAASIELSYHVVDEQYTPTRLTLQEIRDLINMYAAAAVRAMHAGMDMILVHGGHGHFISQFLSPHRNQRSDAYGGSFANRARFINELLEEIRARVGDRLAVAYRISGDELVPDGLRFEEQLALVKTIEDKIDLLHVSAGKLYADHTLQRMFQPNYVPRGLNVPLAAQFKKELNIPVTAVGALNYALAELVIAEGKADMVAMARGILADPDGVNKVRKGEEARVRPCVRCNTCIHRAHSYLLAVRCAVNPVAGREAEYRLSRPAPAVRKKVVVVGGGPAGMEAARRAAERGHEVVLFEKEASLGGNLHYAAAAPFKEDMKKYLQWAVRTTLDTPGVTVKLSTEAVPENVAAEKPDVLIIAAGAAPIMPELPGMASGKVFWAGEVEAGKAGVGERVVIAGAGLVGSETALHLAGQGKKVTLIDPLPLAEVDEKIPLVNIITLRDLLEKHDVVTRPEVKLESVAAAGVIVVDKEGRRTEIPCDSVVLALGLRPRQETVAMLAELAPEVYVVGDCRHEQGNLYTAVSEGFFAAMDI